MLLSVISRLFGGKSKSSGDAAGDGDEAPLEELADETLMLKFGEGNHAAFEILLHRHERPVFRFVRRFVGIPSLAEDITQEVFLRVCKVADRYSKKAKFTTWLYTIARNLCIDHLRKGKGKTHIPIDGHGKEDDAGHAPIDFLPDTKHHSASSETLRKEFLEALDKALEALPDEQREVFIMREVSGLKFREIAEVVGVSEGTIKSRMRYALQQLRGHMAKWRDFSFDADDSADAQHMR